MSVQVTWGDQVHTYILLRLTGDLKAEDLLAAQVEIKSLMDEAPHKVSVVADFSEIERVSSTLLISLPRVISQMNHPNSSHAYIVVQMPTPMWTMISLLNNGLRTFYNVDTLEEAESVAGAYQLPELG